MRGKFGFRMRVLKNPIDERERKMRVLMSRETENENGARVYARKFSVLVSLF